ncbi:MAG: M28 family peptidase, partial [Inquilinus sp.]|nr:M28 family peptidase [Inquilinus sp.]
TLGYYRSETGSQHYPPLFRLFYPDRGDFLALVSNLRSRPEMLRLARAYRAASDYPLEHVATLAVVPGVSWSDHRSFWRHGYRAVMVTDTAFYRYPHYHAAEDTPDKLTYGAFAAALDGLYRALVSITR